MTAIAGFTNGKDWAIAGDSGLFETGDTQIWWPTDRPKVWRVGTTLLGYAGPSSVGDMAEEAKLADAKKLAKFLKENGAPENADWNVLIVNRNSIWSIGEDFLACRMKRRYHVIGGAAGPAWGALYAAKHLGLNPKDAVRIAVESACDHHLWAIRPVSVLAEYGGS